MEDAACKGEPTETFFPIRGDMEGVRRALEFCNGTEERPPCPVRDECLRYSIREGIHCGVFGGETDRGRRKWRKQRRKELNLPRQTPLRKVI